MFAQSDAQIEQEFRDRSRYVREVESSVAGGLNINQGNLYVVAVNLAEGTNVAWARQRLRTWNDPPSGSMFWMVPMVLVMYAGDEHLTAEDWEFIRGLWKSYYPYRGDTENHWLMYYASLYLACALFPDADRDTWFNGRSSAQNMEEAREYILEWVRITTLYGQGEFDSPSYIGTYAAPLAMLATWADDPDLKKAGRMMLDYILLDFAVENVGGIYGGAHSRVYPREIIHPWQGPSATQAWLCFNQGEFRRNAYNMVLALTDYTPPPIIVRIARDRSQAHEHKELKRSTWKMRHQNGPTFAVDNKKALPLYKYSYRHPDYLLGSCVGNASIGIQKQTWTLVWREFNPTGKGNTFHALHAYSDPLVGTSSFPQGKDIVSDLITRSKLDFESPDKLAGGSPHEQVFQHKSTLIGLYDIPDGTSFRNLNTYFSRDLQNVEVSPDGWIFARGEVCYIAYYPLVPGTWKDIYWTGVLDGQTGQYDISTATGKTYVSDGLHNGYIVQVASSREFPTMVGFRNAVRALPLDAALDPYPRVTFTGLDGVPLTAQYGAPPTINGTEVDYATWQLFDGPYAKANRASQTLEILYGQDRYFLDFKSLTISTEIEALP